MRKPSNKSLKPTIYFLVLFLLMGAIMVAAVFVAPTAASPKPPAKNIIVLIADGGASIT